MKQFIVDAFTSTPFRGNPAAVCVPDQWPDDALMQHIAAENNLSETAFTVPEKDGWHLRWFTPGGEIDFCGHATMGTAYTLFRFYTPQAQSIRFYTRAGTLTVRRRGERIEMDFPAYTPRPIPVTPEMCNAIGAPVVEAYLDRDLLLVLQSEDAVRTLHPDQQKLLELDGLLTAVTAAGRECDCVSRVFAPKLLIAEDPVTGSTHCMIAPLWAQKLGKTELTACQASKRGGTLFCRVNGQRVCISGCATLFAQAELNV